MSSSGNRRIIGLAAGVAVAMHLLLFLAVRPVSGNGLVGAPVPPETYYPGRAPDKTGNELVRTVWSPVLFSLPSELGFSRELLNERPRTGLTFRQPDDKESFLYVDPAPRGDAAEINPQQLLLTAGQREAPRPPQRAGSAAEAHRLASRRVYIAPELKVRLMGGIVLPPELNRRGGGDAAWEVRADLMITPEGAIHHVILERPLEDESLNLEVLRLLHSLRFRSGEGPVDGRIEIYSPESTPLGDSLHD